MNCASNAFFICDLVDIIKIIILKIKIRTDGRIHKINHGSECENFTPNHIRFAVKNPKRSKDIIDNL